MTFFGLEIVVTVIAGLSTVAWNILQIHTHFKRKRTLAAITIQRGWRNRPMKKLDLSLSHRVGFRAFTQYDDGDI